MTVKEFKDLLDGMPLTAVVHVLSDAEGNAVHGVHDLQVDSASDTKIVYVVPNDEYIE